MKDRQRWSIDHIFLAVSQGGPEIDGLQAAGFTEGPPNSHPGQGSACRRFFFENAYLEFAWLEAEAEATAQGVQRTGLPSRLALGTEASRLGFAIRLHEDEPPPVRTWPYRPPYLPPELAIPVGLHSTSLGEPLLFFIPAAMGPRLSMQAHENDARRISRIEARIVDGGQPSPQLTWLAQSGVVSIDFGDSESLTIQLDEGRQGQSLDLHTDSPLVLRW